VWPVAGAGAVLLALFVLWERRSRSPTVPLDLLRHRVLGPAITATMLAGVVMFAVSAYVPLSVQNGLYQSAYIAGAAVAPMSVTWPIGSVLSGFLLPRLGYQPMAVAGSLALAAGCALLGLVAIDTVLVGVASGVLGVGMGLISTPILIVVQSSVPWEKRGAATALNQFSRTIGGAVGVSLLGVLLEATAGTGAMGPRLLGGIHAVFLACLGVAGVTFVLTLTSLLGRRGPEQPGVDDRGSPAST
jgi:MFS family permease